MCPLTDYGQEQTKEKIFHGHLLGGAKDLVTGKLPAGLLVFIAGAVDVAGFGAGVVAGAGVGDLVGGVEDLAAGVALREVGFF